MSDELVKRLRYEATRRQGLERFDTLEDEAADRIDALEAALGKADALESCVTALDNPANEEQANEIYGAMLTAAAAYRAAREAVK